jgi:phage gpG-like protein
MAIKWVGLDGMIKTVAALGGQFAILPTHLKKAVPAFVASVKRNFRDGGRPKKWKPKKDGSPSNLIGRTGLLVGGIHGFVEGNTIVVASPRIYSSIHHFGGKTSPHVIPNAFGRGKDVEHPGSVIPARPFMIIPENEMETNTKIIAESIVKGAKL